MPPYIVQRILPKKTGAKQDNAPGFSPRPSFQSNDGPPSTQVRPESKSAHTDDALHGSVAAWNMNYDAKGTGTMTARSPLPEPTPYRYQSNAQSGWNDRSNELSRFFAGPKVHETRTFVENPKMVAGPGDPRRLVMTEGSEDGARGKNKANKHTTRKLAKRALGMLGSSKAEKALPETPTGLPVTSMTDAGDTKSYDDIQNSEGAASGFENPEDPYCLPIMHSDDQAGEDSRYMKMKPRVAVVDGTKDPFNLLRMQSGDQIGGDSPCVNLEPANTEVDETEDSEDMVCNNFCRYIPPLPQPTQANHQDGAARSISTETARVFEPESRKLKAAKDNVTAAYEVESLKEKDGQTAAGEIDKLKAEIDCLTVSLQTEMERQEDKHQVALKKQEDELKAKYDADLAHARQEHDKSFAETVQRNADEHGEDLRKAKSRHEEATSGMNQTIATLKDEHGRTMLKKDHELDQKNQDLRSHKKTIEELQKANRSIESQHQTKVSELNGRIEELQKTNRAVESQLRTKVSELNGKIEELHKKNRNVEKQHEMKVSGLTGTITTVRREYAMKVLEMNGQIEAVTANAARERQRMEKDRKAALQALNKQLDDERSKMIQGYESELSSLRQDLEITENEADEEARRLKDHYSGIINELKKTHGGEIIELEQKLETMTAEAAAKVDNMATDHDREIQELTQTHAIEVSKLKQIQKSKEDQFASRHKKGTQHLRDQVQELNDALLARDDEVYHGMLFSASDLPRKPDEKLKEQFLEVQQIVEELGRLTWRSNPKLWTEQIFQKMSGQYVQRLLRKAILQDMMWTVLFNFVFCSPYRIFGEEGQALEKEWNEQCGEDTSSKNDVYTWPSPGTKAERWRYMTIKECREALTKPVPSQYDPRARLKKGFKNSLDALVAKIKAVLGDMVDLGAESTQLIDRLSKKAATTWLDFEMHRCRIVVRLNGLTTMSTSEKVAQFQKSSLALTVIPMVGRFGNVKGVDLGSFTILDGCAGDTLKIP